MHLLLKFSTNPFSGHSKLR